jgi:hypothetical protein
MKYNKVSRRMFLEGASKTAMAIPFLPSLMPTTAEAASMPLPKYIHVSSQSSFWRMLATPLQIEPWPAIPRVAGTNPNSVPWIQKDPDVKYQSLNDIKNFQGKASWLFNEQWNPFLSRMLLVSNAHAYVGDNRHSSSLNTCCSVGESSTRSDSIYGPLDKHCYSVDFLVEQAFQRMNPSQFGALRVNIMENPGGYESFAYGTINGKPTHLPSMMSVGELRQKVLNAAGVSSQPTTGPNSRKLKIDSVLEDFKSLMNHRRISSVDKQRLADAAEKWYAIEKTLSSGTTAPTRSGSCDPSTIGTLAADNWGARHRLAIDIVTLALACGLTRTVSYTLLQGSDTNNDGALLHNWDHNPDGPSIDVKIDNYFFKDVLRWRADKMIYLLGKLDSTKDEFGQPLLNSSLVTWSAQYSYMKHAMLGHNLVAVGGANGKLETGWHVDAGGSPINRFHLTNMLAMGLNLSDIEKSGEPGFGEVTQLYDLGSTGAKYTHEVDYDGRREYNNSKLPFFAQAAQRRNPFPYLK